MVKDLGLVCFLACFSLLLSEADDPNTGAVDAALCGSMNPYASQDGAVD